MKIIAAFLGDTMKTVEENYMHLSPDYLRQAAVNKQNTQK
jgi:hypothetical protein